MTSGVLQESVSVRVNDNANNGLGAALLYDVTLPFTLNCSSLVAPPDDCEIELNPDGSPYLICPEIITVLGMNVTDVDQRPLRAITFPQTRVGATSLPAAVRVTSMSQKSSELSLI